MLEVCLQHLVGRVQLRGQVGLVSGQAQLELGLVIRKRLFLIGVLRGAQCQCAVTCGSKSV